MSRILTRKFTFKDHTTLLSSLKQMAQVHHKVLDSRGWQGRRVLGFKLPDWQRAPAWTDDQAVRFLESVWLGLGLGTYLVNMRHSDTDNDLILLDGQQRLRAIERYWADELAVRGENGNEYFWSELDSQEQAQFLRATMGWQESDYSTDEELREAYNRHNFSGTAHRPDQAA